MQSRITLLFVGLLSLCSTSILLAQTSTASIKGKVTEASGEAVAFANVILNAQADSSITKVEVTDENGKYQIINVPAGDYWLTVSFVGLPDFKSESFVLKGGATLELPTIQMKEAAQELQEVTVTAKRPLLEVKPDMTVFNVDGSINASGNTALELLRKSPGIVIDNNDNITMLGRSGVQIHIDGRPSPLKGADLANFLRSLNSSEIDAIELITNPSSKYDAAGNAGIINIRLKKDKGLGTNGSVNLGGSTGIMSTYNISANGNYRGKNVNVFGSYSLNDGENDNPFNLYREQVGFVFDQRSTQRSYWFSNNFKLGTDWFINKKSTLGFLVNGNLNASDHNSNSRTLISMQGSSKIDSILLAQSFNASDRKNYNFNLNYSFNNGKGTTLNVDGDLGLFRNEAEAFQPNYYMDSGEEVVLQERTNQNNTPTDIDIYTFKLDYETPFLDGKLAAGVKSAIVRTDNTFDFFNVLDGNPVLNTDRSNQFEYTENVNAAYVNFNRQIKKFGFSLGLRMEQTNSTGELTALKTTDNDKVKRDYIDFFPSGGITYAPNQSHSLAFNFGRRINRPSYQDLNPFENQLDELTFEKGNPFLNPEYAMNVKLTHTYKYRYNTSISYSHTTDQITRITDTAGTNAGFITWLNLADQYNYSLSFSAPVAIKPWWNTYTNITGSYLKNKGDYGDNKIVDLEATAFNIYSQQTFSLPKDWTFEVSGWYNSPSIWGGTFKMDGQYSIDAGIQKKLLDGRANVKVSVSDIFKTTNWNGTSQFGALFIRANGGWDSRRVRLNLTYRFGSNEVKQARRRSTGLEDENRRIK